MLKSENISIVSEIINTIKLKQLVSDNELVKIFKISKNMLTRMLRESITEHKIWAYDKKCERFYHDYITPNIIIAPPSKNTEDYQKEYQRKYRLFINPNYHKKWTEKNSSYHSDWVKNNTDKVNKYRDAKKMEKRIKPKKEKEFKPRRSPKEWRKPKYSPEFLLDLINIKYVLTLDDLSQILNEKSKTNIIRWMKPLLESGQVRRTSNRREYYKVLTELESKWVDFIDSLTIEQKQKVYNAKSKEEIFAIFE